MILEPEDKFQHVQAVDAYFFSEVGIIPHFLPQGSDVIASAAQCLYQNLSYGPPLLFAGYHRSCSFLELSLVAPRPPQATILSARQSEVDRDARPRRVQQLKKCSCPRSRMSLRVFACAGAPSLRPVPVHQEGADREHD